MKILLVNVHSALNLGDEAIMRVTLDELARTFPNVRVVIAANDPVSWRPFRNRAEIVPSLTRWSVVCQEGRWHGSLMKACFHATRLAGLVLAQRVFGWRLSFGTPEQRRLLQAYRESDWVLSCGGGNFYSHRLFSPFFLWALLTLALAIGFGKKVVMLPQSIGPIEGPLQKRLARFVFNRVSLIMTRETISEEYLKRQLRVAVPCLSLADLAFGLRPIVMRDDATREKGIQKHRIGVTILDRGAQTRGRFQQRCYEEPLADFLADMAKTEGAEIHLFSQCYGPSHDHDDRIVTQRFSAGLSKRGVTCRQHEPFADAIAAIQAYGRMDLMVGSRMHTGIFSLLQGIPVILISYQPKAEGMMRLFGMDRFCCSIEELHRSPLKALATELLQHRDDYRVATTIRCDQLHEALADWTRFLKG